MTTQWLSRAWAFWWLTYWQAVLENSIVTLKAARKA